VCVLPSHTVIEIRTRTVVKILGLVIAAAALIEILAAARSVLVLLAVSLFLAVALNPAVMFFNRWMPRALAVAAVFIGLIVLIALFVAALAIPIINQTDDLQKAAPGYVDKLKKDPTLNDLNNRYHLVSKASAAAGELPEKVFGAANRIVTGVAETITAIFLTLFLMLELPTLSAGILSLLPDAQADRIRRVALDVNRQVGGYVIGNLAISVIAGLVTGISLWILGVPYAAALAILMGVFELVPLVGATIGAIAAIGVAFATQGPTAGIIMLIVNIVYQQAENHILQPIVYRRTVQLSAFLVLVAVLLGGALLGLLGALIAIPVAGSIQVIARDVLAGRRAAVSPPPPAEAATPG
jgi:predicted PurR-regulated permease PerM